MIKLFIGDFNFDKPEFIKVPFDSSAIVSVPEKIQVIDLDEAQASAKDIVSFLKLITQYKTEVILTTIHGKVLESKEIQKFQKDKKIVIEKGKSIDSGKLDLWRHVIPLIFSSRYTPEEKIDFLLERKQDISPFMILQIMSRNFEKLTDWNRRVMRSLNIRSGKFYNHELFIRSICVMIKPQTFQFLRWNLVKKEK